MRLEAIETRMDGRVATLEAKIDGKFADLRADMHQGFNDIIKWIVGTVIGVAAVSITIMTFVLNNAVPKASTATPPPATHHARPETSPAAATALPASSAPHQARR